MFLKVSQSCMFIWFHLISVIICSWFVLTIYYCNDKIEEGGMGQDMWHVWWRRWMHTRFWWVNFKETKQNSLWMPFRLKPFINYFALMCDKGTVNMNILKLLWLLSWSYRHKHWVTNKIGFVWVYVGNHELVSLCTEVTTEPVSTLTAQVWEKL